MAAAWAERVLASLAPAWALRVCRRLERIRTLAFWEEYYKDKVIREAEDISDEDMDNAFLIWNQEQANLARIKDEYSQFINGAFLNITVLPYKWWSHLDQRKTYPNLS